MDLQSFGKTLSKLMAEAKLTRPALAKKMHVSISLIDRWKSTLADPSQHRRPTYEQQTQLIQIFAPYLNSYSAQQWALQADHPLAESFLKTTFPPLSLLLPPPSDISVTLGRLEPIPMNRLFGVQAIKNKILKALNHKADYWLLALSGIGGIGKTSLAAVLVQKVLPTSRFRDIVWVSAKQEMFVPHKGLRPTQHMTLAETSLIDNLLTQLDPNLSIARPIQEKQAILRGWFKAHPYLVVIDNLETIQDYEALLTPLRQLANPTKFLLTSRHSLAQHSDVFNHSLTELSEDDTLAFLKYQAKYHPIALTEADDSELKKIYHVVGGNPLALKLILGQIRFSGLPQVLAGLQEAKGKRTDELYRFIYKQIWNSLDEPTRQMFLITPLAHSGTREDLQRLSQLNDDDFNPAIEQLLNRSLLEVRGNLQKRRYHIHSLTRLFLQTKIYNQWKPD